MDRNWFKGLHSVTILRHPISGWYCANYSPSEFKQRLHKETSQKIWCFNRQLLSNFHVSWLLLKEISWCQEPGLAGTESNWWMKAIPTSQCRVLDIEIDCPVERSVSVLYLNLKASRLVTEHHSKYDQIWLHLSHSCPVTAGFLLVHGLVTLAPHCLHLGWQLRHFPALWLVHSCWVWWQKTTIQPSHWSRPKCDAEPLDSFENYYPAWLKCQAGELGQYFCRPFVLSDVYFIFFTSNKMLMVREETGTKVFPRQANKTASLLSIHFTNY